MEDIVKYCAGLNDLCIADLLWSHSSTNQFVTGEWSNWALHIGPVRNGTSCNQKSLMPIVWLAPYTAKGTIDNLVQIWKYYATKEGFRLPEGPFCVTYNGKKVDVGNNVLDVVDRSLSKHYFAIPLPGSDTRNINQLMEFIEGTETGADGKKQKKKKSRKKASLKETPPEEAADMGMGEVAEILEKTKIDSDEPGDKLMSSKKYKKTDKPDQRETESKESETELSFKEGDLGQASSLLHGPGSNIQALKEELTTKTKITAPRLLQTGHQSTESFYKTELQLFMRSI